jgi:transposase-like protein
MPRLSAFGRMPVMPKKFDREVKDRAVRMVLERVKSSEVVYGF